MDKHAYLIMAHNNPGVLEKLICALDDKRNDIFLHIDRKSRKIFAMDEISRITRYTGVHIIPGRKVNWGGYSQIDAELRLLREAVKTEHGRYHLLSGTDLPIRTQDEIHSFFEKHRKEEFLGFDQRAMQTGNFYDRIQYYYFFQDAIGRGSGMRVDIMNRMQGRLLRVQKSLGVDRTGDSNVKFYKGTNWFSITQELAVYVLERESWVRKHFQFTRCADEIFLHTIAMNSPFAENVVDDDLREIDWKRGGPYTYTEEDFDMLRQSPDFFARKFSDEHMELAERIYREIRR